MKYIQTDTHTPGLLRLRTKNVGNQGAMPLDGCPRGGEEQVKSKVSYSRMQHAGPHQCQARDLGIMSPKFYQLLVPESFKLTNFLWILLMYSSAFQDILSSHFPSNKKQTNINNKFCWLTPLCIAIKNSINVQIITMLILRCMHFVSQTYPFTEAQSCKTSLCVIPAKLI